MNRSDKTANTIGLAGLYIFVISMPYSPALSESGFIISFVAAVFLVVSNKHISLPPRIYNIALVLFLTLISITVPFSIDVKFSIQKIGIVRWLLFPYIILNLNLNLKSINRLVKVLLLVSGVFSVYLISQHLLGKSVLPYKFGVYQTVNPSIANQSDRIALRFGQYYAMLFSFMVIYIYMDKKRRQIFINIVSGLSSIAATYFAYARSGAAGIWASLTVWGLIRAKAVFYGMLGITVAGLLFVIVFPHTRTSELFYSTIHPTSVSGIRYGSNMARVHMFDNTLQILKQHPLTGAGFNSYGQWTKLYKPSEKGWERTFSDPLEFLATTGIIGFIGFLIIYFSIFYMLFKYDGVLSNAVLAAFICFAIGGVFEPMFFNTVLLRGMMFFVAISMAANIKKKSALA